MPFENRLSVGKIVAWQLEVAMPGKQWQLEMVAAPGDTLRGQYAKLARLAVRPDAIIVYCGHNEFTVGIPWSRRVNHYRDDRLSVLGGLDDLAGRISPLCALIRETADRFRAGLMPPIEIQPLVDVPACSPEEYAAPCLNDFRTRLEAIARFGRRIGAVVIFVVNPTGERRRFRAEPLVSTLQYDPAERALRLLTEFLACALGRGSRVRNKPWNSITRC